MRLDIVTNDAGELVRRERARELGASVVVAIYRLVKLAQMHDLQNQAFLRQLEQTHQMIGEYCLRAGTNVSILFAHRAVFVAGQLLKGSRTAYEAASELGDFFGKLGGSDLLIQRDVTREELFAFAEHISQRFRTQAGAFQSPTPKIRLRAVTDAARLRGLELEKLGDDQRIVRTYASAVVIMRRFYEDLLASKYVLPRRIKRIAQSLVDLSDGATTAFLGVTEVRNANHDEAGRAVNSAILAVAMAREMTEDRTQLVQVAMAAMMHDVARPRALALASQGEPALPGMQGPTMLSEDQEDRLPAASAAVLTALGRLNEPSITRTVLTYEALWLRRRTWLGPVYWGAREPTLHARLITVARRYNDLLTPEPGLLPPTADFAVATLADELKDPQDRLVLRLLVSALGLLPMGTVVQLDTGELAEVVRGTKGHGERPLVRIQTSGAGAPVEGGRELDLEMDRRRKIVRVISVEGWQKGLALRPSQPEGAPESVAPPAPAAAPASAPTSEPDSASLGTSPSQVGEAMGELFDAPAPASPPRERTLFQPGAPAPPANTSSSSAPTARGDLATTPLPHVLVYMLDHELTGSVVFKLPGGDATLYYAAGIPTKVRVPSGSSPLGGILADAGALDPAKIAGYVDGAKKLGVLFGEYLVGNDLVARETVSWALETQLLTRAAEIAAAPGEATYEFYQDVDLLEGWGGGDVTVDCAVSPVLACVRRWPDRARVRATIGRLAQQPLVVHADADLAMLAVSKGEQAVLDALQAEPQSFAQLVARADVNEEEAASLVYTLAVTRQLALKGATKAPMAPRSARVRRPLPAASTAPRPPTPAAPAPAPAATPSRAPAPSSPSLAPRKVAIRPVSPAAPRASLAPGSAPKIVRRSQAPAPAPAPAPPTVAADLPDDVLDEMNTIAFVPGSSRGVAELLAAQRAAGMRSPVSAAPPPAAPSAPPNPVTGTVDVDEEGIAAAEAALEAMQSFRMAEAALQRGDHASALALATKAATQDPSQIDYVALAVWVRAIGTAPPAVDAAVAEMTRALEGDPENERALLYRGKLHVRANRPADAQRDFAAILAANPHHREAASEMRALKKPGG